MMSKTISVQVDQLQKWYRDLDACQKVIWLAGCRPHVPNGFDPAYCEDAQASLAQMDVAMAALCTDEPDRDAFEVEYRKEFEAARGYPLSAADMKSLRAGDSYGTERVYLNGQWAGWKKYHRTYTTRSSNEPD